jgi:hypothetical protein
MKDIIDRLSPAFVVPHHTHLFCRSYFAADAGEYELHITALFTQNSGLADPSAGVTRSFIKTPLTGSPFNVMVTFADEADASTNTYQQPKRLCTLDDIASPSGGASLDMITIFPNPALFFVQALMAAGSMRACACKQRRQVLIFRSQCRSAVTFSQGVRFVEPRMTIYCTHRTANGFFGCLMTAGGQ